MRVDQFVWCLISRDQLPAIRGTLGRVYIKRPFVLDPILFNSLSCRRPQGMNWYVKLCNFLHPHITCTCSYS